MPEYLSSGLWRPREATLAGGDGLAPVRECDPASMGLSTALLARLGNWCAEYERLDVARPGNAPNLTSFAAEGLEIARALQAELPKVAVWYFDESLHDIGRPRREYLYRVTSRS